MERGEKFEHHSTAESEVDTILQMQDLAMNDDPHIACMGRIVKTASFPLANAIHLEVERCKNYDELIDLLNPIACAIATCVYGGFDQIFPEDVRPDVRLKALKVLRDCMVYSLDRIYERDQKNGN